MKALNVILSLTFLLTTACGAVTAGKTTSSANATANNGSLYITQVSPAEGTVTSVPTSIAVQFSQIYLDSTQASLASNYQLVCNGASVQATGVTYASGWANVTFAARTEATGTVCYFVASTNIVDANGNALSGTLQTAYGISNSGTFSWAESSTSTTAAIQGGSGGTTFNEAGADGMALSSLNLNVVNYLQGVQGVWMSSTGTTGTGAMHGVSPMNNAIACPSGYRITGVFGYYSNYINSIGLICQNASQTSSAQVPQVGVVSGNSFTVTCPSGTFATGLTGRAGAVLDAIGLTCR